MAFKMKPNRSTNNRSKSLITDPTNLGLLRALQTDPRLPISQLARRVGMSAPAVRERLQRLEDSGVINGYRLDLRSRASIACSIAFLRTPRRQHRSCSPHPYRRVRYRCRATPHNDEQRLL
jgi:DNA-binding Lrp family transcriptional regulator